MLYAIEIRRGREELSKIMSHVREWLDGRQLEPDTFRCTTDQTILTCRLEFKFENEVIACAEAFGEELRPMGGTSVL